MTNFLCIAVLVMCWVCLPLQNITNQFRLPQGIALNFVMIVTFLISAFKGIKFSNKYLILFVSYLLFSIFLQFIVPIGIEVRGLRQANVVMINHIIYILLTTLFIISISEINFNKIAKALCISACLVSGFSILQFVGLDPLKSIANYNCTNKISACLDNPNLVGMYLAIISPLFLKLKVKLAVIGYCLTLLGILITQSHLALFCAIIGIIAFVLFHYKYAKVALVIALILVLAIGFFMIKTDYIKMHNNLSGRLPVWQFAFEKFKSNTLFGVGLGTFQTYQYKSYNGDNFTIWSEAHNDWLQYLLEIGIIGMSFFVLLLVNTFRNIQDYAYATSFLVFLIAMLGSFPIEVPSIAFVGLLTFCGTSRKALYGNL